jgi:hypothetical protein
VVVPHQPYCEQQVPKDEPVQVKLVVPPQVPSVDTFKVELAAVDVLVFVDVAVVFVVVVVVFTEELDEPLQVPNPDWQPVPQYAEVLPHPEKRLAVRYLKIPNERLLTSRRAATVSKRAALARVAICATASGIG